MGVKIRYYYKKDRNKLNSSCLVVYFYLYELKVRVKEVNMHETEIHRNTIEKLKRGSYEAFDTLYDMYADSLYGFALLHTKSSVQAEDIVQETFLKLWNMRTSLSVEGSFKSMLFTIAKNHVIDVFRQQINRPDFEDYIRFCEDEHLLDNTSVEKYITMTLSTSWR